MTSRKPPRLAAKLLERLTTPSVFGDLLEAFQDGRSRWWFWWQVIGSIAAMTIRDVVAHPFLTARAIIVGHAFVWSIAHYAMFDLLHYDEWLFSRGLVAWFYLHGYGLRDWSVWPATALLIALSGWIVTRTDQAARPGAVVIYALSVACLSLGFGLWRLAHPLPAQAYLVGIRESFPYAVCAFLGGVVGLRKKITWSGLYE